MEKYLSNYILRTSLADSAIIERKARIRPEVSKAGIGEVIPEKSPMQPATKLIKIKMQ